jgi:hypothetical protein
VVNIYRVYKAVISVLVPIRRMVKLDHENEEMMIISSPVRLIVGGSARLVKLAVSHHRAISGSIVCRPRVRSMVQLCTRS